jgi:hypothetical protein
VQTQRTVQPETNHRFSGNVDFFALRDDLGSGTGSRARDSAYGRAFSAACNRADDSPKHRSATHELACALVGSNAVAPVFKFLVRGADAIAAPSDPDRVNIQRDIAIAFDAARYQAGV